MSRKRRPAEQPTLFDLELRGDSPEPSVEGGEPQPSVATSRIEVGMSGEPEEAETSSPEVLSASRLFGGLVDLLVHLGVLALVIFGLRLMGVHLTQRDWGAVALLLAVFSLFYTVIPLAFWSRTPGMAAAGLVARGERGEALSFGQATWRWLAGILTLASLGTLLLLAHTGRSLADRLGRSRTLSLQGPP